MTDDVVIRCEGLTRRFGSFVAVRDVTFEVRRKTIFGLLGPNGSGKTTIIRMLCGVLRPTAGRAWIAGHDVEREADRIKGLIGYMSQQFSLYDELTVFENLTFFGRLYGLRGRELAQRREELLELMHLAPYCDRLARMLSGGWRQRLAMACALMHHPQVLFLDEPTAGIDPVARRELWDMLFALSGQGMTLFVTTHYMDEAERCSHVAYVYQSRLIVCGEPDVLKALPEVNPQGTQRLDVNCDHVTTALRIARQLPGVRSATIFGQSMHLLVDADFSEVTLRARLSESGIHEVEVHPIAPSLEDVFVELTRIHTEKLTAGADV